MDNRFKEIKIKNSQTETSVKKDKDQKVVIEDVVETSWLNPDLSLK
jgi:hypothetical protein